MHIKSQKDFFSGLMFCIVGATFAWGASSYSIGTAARMGPGYFPLALGVLLALLGVFIVLNAFVSTHTDGDKVGSFAWRPLVFIIAANLVFGAALGGLPTFGLKPLGLIAGVIALTFIASLASDEFRLKEVSILALVLCLISYAAFILLLKLQFPVWPVYFVA